MAYTPTTWVDNSAPAISATNLNHLETGLQTAAATADAALAAPTPVTNGPVYWTGAAWTSAKLTTSQIAAGAGIAYSQLTLAGGIVNADISTSAAIATSKISGLPTYYRKVTAKDVVNTITATDLLNGEITIAAGALAATGIVRATLVGDYLNNSGSNAGLDIFVKLGATTIYDSTGAGLLFTAGAGRRPWRLEFNIVAGNATNAQFTEGKFVIGSNVAATTGIGRISDDNGATAGVVAAAQGTVESFGSNGSTAVDMTSAQALIVQAKHGTAALTISMRLQGALIEVL